MNSTTIALVLFAVIGAWMWWRMRGMPPLPATRSPAAAGSRSAAADGSSVAYDLDLLAQTPAEYAGRTDLAQVVLVNDDTTPMEVVILVLRHIFQFPDDLAFQATVAAHAEGECMIAVLPAEVAAERMATIRALVEKAGGHPLQIVARPLPSEAGQPAA